MALSLTLSGRYDPLSSCLVDFKGRANVASVKNCQLIESSPALSTGGAIPKPDQEKEFKLQLGKVANNCKIIVRNSWHFEICLFLSDLDNGGLLQYGLPPSLIIVASLRNKHFSVRKISQRT